MLITPLPLNTRHAGPRQVAVGPGALRQLICDTTKVNTGAAETTRTDQQAAQLRERALALETQAAHVPQPIGDRLRATAARLRDQVGKHDRTRITTGKNAG
jgi:hypothetical protein